MSLHERVEPLVDKPLGYLKDLYKVYLPKDQRPAVDKMDREQILDGFLAQGVDIGERTYSIDVRGEISEDDGLNFD